MPKLIRTPEMEQYILNELANGRTLSAVMRDDPKKAGFAELPNRRTVILWTQVDPEFKQRFQEARAIGYQLIADELLDIADDATNDWMETHDPDNPGYRVNGEHINRSRLRLDTRKWVLAKALPKMYGEKVVHQGDDDNPVQVAVTQQIVFKAAKIGD